MMTKPLQTTSLRVGDMASDFTLQNQYGESVTLSALWEEGPVVVFFYPRNGTPVCTAEVCSFRDGYAQFKQLGAQIVGISQDTVLDHAKFSEKHALPYSILSDPNNDIRNQWQVPRFLGWMPGRMTYVLAKGGTVLHTCTSMTQAEVHVNEALKVLEETVTLV